MITEAMKPHHWIIIALAAGLIIMIWLYRGSQRDRYQAETMLIEKEAEITRWKSASGRQVTEKPAAVIGTEDLSRYPEVVAELKDMKIQLRNVRAVLKAAVESKGEGLVRVVRDTIVVSGLPVVADSMFIDDGYLDLKSDGQRYAYTYQDSITFALSEKKTWLLGKKSLIGTLKLSNPNASAVSQTSILVSQRQKRWGIMVGIGYDPFGQRAFPTVSAGYNLVRF